ncbi:hypothetical protein [Prosthecobacter sp.]|uniref:hypothetical protein n=1 Tax=Prosthecobacter sp. TaxID=1965333 RepID=UPI0037847494
MEKNAPAAISATEPIVCHVTRWYYRRMSMMSGLFLVFGGLFLYDGIWGYPEAVVIAKEKEWFQKEFQPSFEAARKEGRLPQWIAENEAKGMPTGVDGEMPRWSSYAAKKGWPEETTHYTAEEIAGQFHWAYGCFAVGLIPLVMMLMNRKKVLRGEADFWVTPEGVQIPYAEVFRVDKRKWEVKALAYAWYRKDGAAARRAVFDDLKFAGADKILDRLLSRFSGELIEKVIEPAPAESASEQPEK